MNKVFSVLSMVGGLFLISVGFLFIKFLIVFGIIWILMGLYSSFIKDRNSSLFSLESSVVPPQYYGLPKEVVEELWPEPMGNSKKAKEERKRRNKALAVLKSQKGDWSMKHGKTMGTDVGDFWWYEFENNSWKVAKQKGQAKWGEYRIYFDISSVDASKLSPVFQQISSSLNIPLAYKFLDTQKTHQSLRGDTNTKFVANFRNVADAKNFYQSLSKNQDYMNIQVDSPSSYQGLRLDNKAEFSGGFSEKRTAEQNLASGKLVGNSWVYKNKAGKERRLDYSEPTIKNTIDNAIQNQKNKPSLDKIWENA